VSSLRSRDERVAQSRSLHLTNATSSRSALKVRFEKSAGEICSGYGGCHTHSLRNTSATVGLPLLAQHLDRRPAVYLTVPLGRRHGVVAPEETSRQREQAAQAGLFIWGLQWLRAAQLR
jgi:hypothetical protein